jgi:hypothetical protein
MVGPGEALLEQTDEKVATAKIARSQQLAMATEKEAGKRHMLQDHDDDFAGSEEEDGDGIPSKGHHPKFNRVPSYQQGHDR